MFTFFCIVLIYNQYVHIPNINNVNISSPLMNSSTRSQHVHDGTFSWQWNASVCVWPSLSVLSWSCVKFSCKTVVNHVTDLFSLYQAHKFLTCQYCTWTGWQHTPTYFCKVSSATWNNLLAACSAFFSSSWFLRQKVLLSAKCLNGLYSTKVLLHPSSADKKILWTWHFFLHLWHAHR